MKIHDGVLDQSTNGRAARDVAAVELRELRYQYQTGERPALADVSFRVLDGESVGLIGPNGAGKTTLFLCLCGVLGVKRGMAKLAGLDPADKTERKHLPSKVGIVFQNSDDQLFNPTVFDEVAFGPLNLELPADEVRRRVSDALDCVGMAGRDETVPFHLSGGEKRRIALAGVLAMKPQILLLDEPTIFLDPRGRREFLELLQTIPATKLIATHDLEMVRSHCDRVLLLDEGRLIAEGKPDDVMSDAALMDAHGLETPYSLRR